MQVLRLQISGLRILEAVELEPCPGWNLLLGDNGAGKTSILEALFLLGHGRSFRRGPLEALVRRGGSAASVFAKIEQDTRIRRLGLSRGPRSWEARCDGEPVASLGALLREFPVLCFEPESHALIAGAAEERRRFLDWGLFHVEPQFLEIWRRYQRSLRQRNALLKQGAGVEQLGGWERELANWGELLDRQRQTYVEALAPHLARLGRELLPELGDFGLDYQPGWRREERGLLESLQANRARDLALGYTLSGPHRADALFQFANGGGRDRLSRGQEKAAALLARLGQAWLLHERAGIWPVLLLDDLAAELDALHLERALALLEQIPTQRWITAARDVPELGHARGARFHVEQGQVARLV